MGEDGQFQRSVHGSGHDGRCCYQHRPLEVRSWQVLPWTVSERKIIADCLIIDRCCSWAKIAGHVGAGGVNWTLLPTLNPA